MADDGQGRHCGWGGLREIRPDWRRSERIS